MTAPTPSQQWAIIACLTLLNFAVFGQILGHSFVHYDDGQFIFENEMVQRGLTSESVRWALTATELGYYPLTWLSHMADFELWGLRAGGHLAAGLLLHIVSTALLFAALLRLSGALGESAVVAALFAIHPAHVESVAWASERKDTLSTVFGMLALLLYARFAQKDVAQAGTAADEGAQSGVSVPQKAPTRLLGLLPVAIAMALSLGAKQMLVTLPFVLLLVDSWPLRRLRWRAAGPAGGAGCPRPLQDWRLNAFLPRRLLVEKTVEKTPLFALTIAGCALALAGQRSLRAIQSPEMIPLADRVRNALVAYATYLEKLFWPVDLAVLYPLSRVSTASVVTAALFLLTITVASWILRERAPYLLAGWLWFVGTLVPVIGIVQIGSQSMADRYTYFPYVGLFIAAVWGARDVMRRLGLSWKAQSTAAAAVILVLAGAAFRQTAYWKNTPALFEHTLAVTGDNPLAEYTLGQSLQLSEPDRALPHLRRGAELMEKTHRERPGLVMPPEFSQSYVGIGTALLMKARAVTEAPARLTLIDEAARAYRTALQHDSGAGNARRNLALAMAMRGQGDSTAARVDQLLTEGTTLTQQRKIEEAVRRFREARALAPNLVEPRVYLALGLAQSKQNGEAATQLMEAEKLDAVRANDILTRALRLPPSPTNLRRLIEQLSASTN